MGKTDVNRAWRAHKRANGITTRKRRDKVPANLGWQLRESIPWPGGTTNNGGLMERDSRYRHINSSNKNGMLTGREARRANGMVKSAKAGFRKRNKRKAAYAAYIASTNPNREPGKGKAL